MLFKLKILYCQREILIKYTKCCITHLDIFGTSSVHKNVNYILKIANSLQMISVRLGPKEPKLGHRLARPLSGASIRRAHVQQGGRPKGRRPPSLESPALVPIRKLDIE
jgi:hypothetical protein